MSLEATTNGITEQLDKFGDAIRKNRNLEKDLPELLTCLSGNLEEVLSSSSLEEFAEALEFITCQMPDVKLRSAIGKFVESIRMSENRADLMRLARQTVATT